MPWRPNGGVGVYNGILKKPKKYVSDFCVKGFGTFCALLVSVLCCVQGTYAFVSLSRARRGEVEKRPEALLHALLLLLEAV